VLFLALLSFALIHGSTRDNPTQYNDRVDKLRGFCEIFSIIFLIVQLVDEFDEMARFVESQLLSNLWLTYNSRQAYQRKSY
jgi:hypothetical protein